MQLCGMLLNPIKRVSFTILLNFHGQQILSGTMEKYSIRNVRPLIILTSSFLLISVMRFASSYPIEWTEIFDSVWYASSANSFFHSFQLLIGGKFNTQGQPLYSMLISPAYLFDSMSKTFIAIKLINSVVMSSTLFPVFLLARNFMTFSRAIVVAILSILIGPMFYTFTIMAENLHYPICMWLVYLIYLSSTTEDSLPRLILGFLFGLAVLNKMSSSALLVGYIILLGLGPFTRLVSIKNLPSIYLKKIVRSGNVFVAFAITILPYIIWRIALNDNSSAVPYSDVWHRFFNNILHFDILKYFKWVLVYFGQLNLSTGLFLLPISIIALISLFKSDEREKRFFSFLVTVLFGCVLAVAVLQSGYNFGRLTERHFFVLTPLVFILSFFWFQGMRMKNKYQK